MRTKVAREQAVPANDISGTGKPALVISPVAPLVNPALKSLDVSAFNAEAERAFLQICADECGKARARDIIGAAAYEIGISTETAKRYLLKYTSRRAPFMFDADGILQMR